MIVPLRTVAQVLHRTQDTGSVGHIIGHRLRENLAWTREFEGEQCGFVNAEINRDLIVYLILG